MHVSTPAGARLTIRLAGRAGAIRLVRVEAIINTMFKEVNTMFNF
jgi:hypothetical protein